ncbi:MAG: metal ABC transporter permease [Aquiluna sp.]
MDISDIFNFSNYDQLIPLVANSLWAGALLALIGGLVGVFVMHRELSFAVHGISELSFAGAAIFLLIGLDVVLGSVFGSLLAAAIIAFLGDKARDRNSIVAVLMPFGLGIGIMALSLYPGRAANKFGLLTGQIVAVDDPKLTTMVVTAVIVVAALVLLWRPLTFASLDAEVAAARGVNTRLLGIGFVMLLGLAVAAAVQIVGALLVLALLVTPAAAALRLSSSQFWVPALSVIFALVSMLGGALLALGGTLPISPYVTTISFLIYLTARLIQYSRAKVVRN